MTTLGTKATQVQPYQVDGVKLDGGLNFTDPKVFLEPGTLSDCLNHEMIDNIGYRGIDGFNKYDGHLSPSIEDWRVITDFDYVGSVVTAYPVGSALEVNSNQDKIFGIVLGHDDVSKIIYYARVNRDYEPIAGDTINVVGGATGNFVCDADPVSGSSEKPAADTAKDFIDDLNTYNGVLRGQIGSLHDTPIGLHWFRDRLFSVVDERSMTFTGGGTTELLPNQYIEGDASGAQGRVLKITLTGGTWAGGNAAGTIEYELLSSTDFSSTEDLDVYPDDTFTTPDTTGIATLGTIGATATTAGLWQSRTEQQAVDELSDVSLAGWSKIDLGWEIDYIEGDSSSGEFTRIQRGQENNFTFTSSSTSTAGTNGVWNTFHNGAILPADSPTGGTTAPGRVSNGDPGWISSTATTAYATTSTSIESDDSAFLYGDSLFYVNQPGYAIQVLQNDIWAIGVGASPWSNSTYTASGSFVRAGEAISRAPIILSDLGAIGALLPDNSIVVGAEIEVNYDYQVQYRAGVSDVTANYDDIIPGQFSGLLTMRGAIGRYNTTTNTFTREGTGASATMALDTTGSNWTTYASAGSGSGRVEGTRSVTGASVTIGSSTSVLGTSSLSKEDFLDTDLAVALYVNASGGTFTGLTLADVYGIPRGSPDLTLAYRTKLDKVRIKLYYTEPSVRYYFEDGAGDICSADLVYYTVVEGDLRSGSAEGKMQLVNITPVSGGKRCILKGDTIHVANPPSAGNQVAKVDDNAGADTGDVGMTINGLPSLSALTTNDSRYQFITANFFARDDWDGFYGVSGAGQAFSFSEFDADEDGTEEQYVIKITTNSNEPTEDKPRHVAFHHYHLALGFNAGIVRFSVPGEPENFDGVAGASELGVGDKVTGLLQMRGATLGVFCENSIWAVQGVDASSFSTQVLAPSTGAIEYTVVDVGVPVFCDSRGISTLDQSEKYGDFLGQRMSYAISPWIIPRTQKSASLFSVANASGVVCAIPARSKNQYRVFFKDGYVLCMSLNPDLSPEFTFSRYFIGQTAVSETNKYMVPLAWSSQVDNNGEERIHVSHYSTESEVSATDGQYVYELDDGWSFDGKFIPRWVVTNWHYQGSPFTHATVRKARLEGQTKGYANLVISTASDYEDVYSTQTVDISLSIDKNRTPLSDFSSDFRSCTNIANLAETGRNISFKIENTIPTGDTISDPQPPYVLQALLIQFAPGKPDL